MKNVPSPAFTNNFHPTKADFKALGHNSPAGLSDRSSRLCLPARHANASAAVGDGRRGNLFSYLSIADWIANISEGVRGIATPSFRRLLLKVLRPVARLEGRAVTTSIRSSGNGNMQESRYTTEKIFIMVWYCGLDAERRSAKGGIAAFVTHF